MDVKYPHIQVKLVGEDENALAILGRVGNAMKRAKVSQDEIEEFRREATSGNYDHLLQTVMNTEDIAPGDEDEYGDDYDADLPLTPADVRYPHIRVNLVGEDANALAILGQVSRAMKRARVSQDEIDEFRREAMSGNYDHLLQTVMSTVDTY